MKAKKIVSLFLAAALLFGAISTCLVTGASAETAAEPTENESAVDLDGKKVIFIGNSHTYYGNAVIVKKSVGEQATQAARVNDKGYFYQICKANGAEVDVTNWTFGGHCLSDTFIECAADRGCDGVHHQDELVDRYYDYVFIQQGCIYYGHGTEFLNQVALIQDMFREANPNVKFIFLAPRRAYEHDLAWLQTLKYLPQQGVQVVEWGAMVDDLITGKTVVPETNLTYNQNSFIIRKSSSDGYHPNLLTGYLTAQMAYCAITGESAVGQDYSFCLDSSVNSNFDADDFIEEYYTFDGATTNFPEIFASETDMRGLQGLIDEYLEAEKYMDYYDYVRWTVDGVGGTENTFATLQEAMEQAEKTTWSSEAALKISLSTETAANNYIWYDANGVAWGVNTIWRGNRTPGDEANWEYGNKLPITIVGDGARLRPSSTKGEDGYTALTAGISVQFTNDIHFVKCSPEYDLKTMEYFAGSGNLHIEWTKLAGGTRIQMRGCAMNEGAFLGWTQKDIDAIKSLNTNYNLVPTGWELTGFRHRSGSSGVSGSGYLNGEAVTTTAENADLVHYAPAVEGTPEAVVLPKDTYVRFVVNKGAAVGAFLAVGGRLSVGRVYAYNDSSALPATSGSYANATASFQGTSKSYENYTDKIIVEYGPNYGHFCKPGSIGENTSAVETIYGPQSEFTGDFEAIFHAPLSYTEEITVDDKVLTCNYVTNKVAITGTVTVTIKGGTWGTKLYSPKVNCGGFTLNIEGGTFGILNETTAGVEATGFDVTNNIKGGNIEKMFAVYSADNTGRTITNNLSAGTVGVYYGGAKGGNGDANTIVNTISGEVEITTFYGGAETTKNHASQNVITTTVSGGQVTAFRGGAAHSSASSQDEIHNVVTGGKITTFLGMYNGRAKSITNDVYGGEITTFCGGGYSGRVHGDITNNFYNGAFPTKVYGGSGTYSSASSSCAANIVNNIYGGKLEDVTFSGGPQYAVVGHSDAESGELLPNNGDITTKLIPMQGYSVTASGEYLPDYANTDPEYVPTAKNIVIGKEYTLEAAKEGKALGTAKIVAVAAEGSLAIADANSKLLVLDAVDNANGALKVKHTGNWYGDKKYIKAPKTSVLDIAAYSHNSYGRGCILEDGDYIYVATSRMAPTLANIILDEKISIGLYFEKAELDKIVNVNHATFDNITTTLGTLSGKYLSDGTVETVNGVEYYYMAITGISPKSLNEEITLSGRVFTGTFTLNEILEITISSAEDNAKGAALIALCKSIQKLGGAEVEVAAPEVAGGKMNVAQVEDASFKTLGIGAVMNDAIGMTIYFNPAENAFVKGTHTVHLGANGIDITDKVNIDTTNGYIDLFVSVTDADKEFTVEIKNGDVVECTITTSIKELVSAYVVFEGVEEDVKATATNILAYIQAANAYKATQA